MLITVIAEPMNYTISETVITVLIHVRRQNLGPTSDHIYVPQLQYREVAKVGDNQLACVPADLSLWIVRPQG